MNLAPCHAAFCGAPFFPFSELNRFHLSHPPKRNNNGRCFLHRWLADTNPLTDPFSSRRDAAILAQCFNSVSTLGGRVAERLVPKARLNLHTNSTLPGVSLNTFLSVRFDIVCLCQWGQSRLMANSWRLLVSSAVLNVLLGAAYIVARPSVPSAKPVPHLGLAQENQAVALQPPVTNAVTNVLPGLTLDWRAVESDDYKRYIANLRSAGCPEKTVHDVIVADINEMYRHRFRQLFPATNRLQYWKTSTPMADLYDEDRVARRNELQREKRLLLTALLGSNYSDQDDLSALQLDSSTDRTLEFLNPEKRNALKELEDRFTVKMMQTYKSTWRHDEGPADQVREQKDAAVMEVLTPEEKFEYDLRKSDTALFLRFGLGGFEVTEQEFRAVFPELKTFIDAAGKAGFGAMVRGEPDPRPEAAQPRAEFKARLGSILGPERFARLVQQTRWNLNVEEQP
jgi:hypothetical protein